MPYILTYIDDEHAFAEGLEQAKRSTVLCQESGDSVKSFADAESVVDHLLLASRPALKEVVSLDPADVFDVFNMIKDGKWTNAHFSPANVVMISGEYMAALQDAAERDWVDAACRICTRGQTSR